jgi:hypothetical protein
VVEVQSCKVFGLATFEHFGSGCTGTGWDIPRRVFPGSNVVTRRGINPWGVKKNSPCPTKGGSLHGGIFRSVICFSWFHLRVIMYHTPLNPFNRKE